MSEHPPDATRETRRAALTAILTAPSEKERAAVELQQLDAEEAAERERAGRDAAEKRMLGIGRAYGSLVAEFPDDEARVRQAHDTLCAALVRLNTRFSSCVGLRAEAAALADRFAVPAPALPAIPLPIQRPLDLTLPGLTEHGFVQQAVEQCEHHVRQRRSYAEIAGSEGYAIIQSAGLKPWPPLTERQQALVADREREKLHEQREARKFGAEAAIARALPPRAPGNVRRG